MQGNKALQSVGSIIKNPILVWSLKLMLLVLVSWHIMNRVDIESSIFDFSISTKQAIFALLALCLAPINTALEGKKWQLAIRSFHPMTPINATRSVLIGNAVGIVTPAKIGEYGGRLIDIDVSDYSNALGANLLCSIAQNVVNLFFGTIAAFIGLTYYRSSFSYLTVSLVTFMLLLALILVIIVMNYDALTAWILSNVKLKQLLKRLHQNINLNQIVSHQSLSAILSYSGLRYTVYLSQYIFITYAFGFEVPFVARIIGVGIIFMIQSGLVLPPLLGFMARAELALFVWTLFGVLSANIVGATVVLWLINIALPALVGSVLLLWPNRKDILT